MKTREIIQIQFLQKNEQCSTKEDNNHVQYLIIIKTIE